ncbi:MAG TPA: hypothetical protein VIZ22_08715 [Candidatus Limnocylindrales bacterium]
METFVIRLWSPADGAPAAGSHDVRGVARHVGSGGSGTFRDETELLEAYRGQRGRVLRLLELTGGGPPRRGPRLSRQPIDAF